MPVDGFKLHGAAVVAVLASGIGAAVAGGGGNELTLAGPQVLRLIQDSSAALASYPAVRMSGDAAVHVGSSTVHENLSGLSDPSGSNGVFTVGVPSAGKSITFLIVRRTFYSRIPASQLANYPGRHWMSCQPFAQQQQSTSTTDPQSYLRLFPGADGPVRVIGHDTISGVPTTHYRVDVDVLKAIERADGLGQSTASLQQLEELGVRTMPLDVWLDAQHAPRQMRFRLHVRDFSFDMTMRISGSMTAYRPVTPASTDTFAFSDCQSMFQQAATG